MGQMKIYVPDLGDMAKQDFTHYWLGMMWCSAKWMQVLNNNIIYCSWSHGYMVTMTNSSISGCHHLLQHTSYLLQGTLGMPDALCGLKGLVLLPNTNQPSNIRMTFHLSTCSLLFVSVAGSSRGISGSKHGMVCPHLITRAPFKKSHIILT